MSKISKFFSTVKDFNQEKQQYKEIRCAAVKAKVKERCLLNEKAAALGAQIALEHYKAPIPMATTANERNASDNLICFIEQCKSISLMEKSPEYQNINSEIGQYWSHYFDNRKNLLKATRIQMANEQLPAIAFTALHLWENAKLWIASHYLAGFKTGQQSYKTVHQEEPSIYALNR